MDGTVDVGRFCTVGLKAGALMEFCPPLLLGAAESARRRPEHEAPAAAGGSAPLPVPSAPHRWALGRPRLMPWRREGGKVCSSGGVRWPGV